MRATGWHGGGSTTDPGGYGIRFSAQDRQKHFDPLWETVILEMDGDRSTTITLNPSFWRSCSELRSADIGQWLLDAQVAPWSKGAPPGIAVNRIADNRFSARVLKPHVLGSR
jgi:hypothetical protein